MSKLPVIVRKIEQFLSWIDETNPNALNKSYEEVRSDWHNDYRRASMSAEDLQNKYRHALHVADVARRLYPDAAEYRQFYEAVFQEITVQGAPIDERNIRSTLRQLADKRLQGMSNYLGMAQEALDELQRDRVNATRYEHLVYRLIEELRTAALTTLSANQAKRDNLRSGLDNLRGRKPDVEDRLADIVYQVEFYCNLVDAFSLVRAGSISSAQSILEILEKQFQLHFIQEFGGWLGVTLEDVQEILKHIQQSPDEGRITRIQKDFIAAALEGTLRTFRKEIYQQDIVLTPSEKDIVIRYDEYSRILLFAQETQYTFTDEMMRLFFELLTMMKTFPELRRTIAASTFIQSAESYYRTLKRKIEEFEAGNQTEAYDLLLYEQAFDLARLLRQLRRNYGESL